MCHFTLKGTGGNFLHHHQKEMLCCYKTKPKQTNEVRVPQTEMYSIVFKVFCTAPVPTEAVWEGSVLLMASIPWERKLM